MQQYHIQGKRLHWRTWGIMQHCFLLPSSLALLLLLPLLVEELQEHVKRVTAPYKYPREIEFVSALPKTISGKIRRVELRQREEALKTLGVQQHQPL